MLALLLIILGASLRFIPHIPNVNPVASIALFGAVYLPNKRLALIVPLAIMVISDIALGVHTMVGFTWGAMFFVSLLGISLCRARKMTTVLCGSLSGSVIFFVVTNLGVWLMTGWYPQTLKGLAGCFITAIPFFRTFLAGTLAYSFGLFAAYEIAARGIRRTRFAKAFLA